MDKADLLLISELATTLRRADGWMVDGSVGQSQKVRFGSPDPVARELIDSALSVILAIDEAAPSAFSLVLLDLTDLLGQLDMTPDDTALWAQLNKRSHELQALLLRGAA